MCVLGSFLVDAQIVLTRCYKPLVAQISLMCPIGQPLKSKSVTHVCVRRSGEDLTSCAGARWSRQNGHPIEGESPPERVRYLLCAFFTSP